MKRYVITGIITVVVIAGISFIFNRSGGEEASIFNSNEEYFIAIVEVGLREVYEGFIGYEPAIIIQRFKNVKNEDFEGVVTGFGAYEVVDGGLAFRPNEGEPFSEHKTYISPEGMVRLLLNISHRLGIELTDQKSVEAIIEAIE